MVEKLCGFQKEVLRAIVRIRIVSREIFLCERIVSSFCLFGEGRLVTLWPC